MPGPSPAPVGGIERDPIDVRDRAYEPTLARLAPRRDLDPDLAAALRDPASPWGLPRLQGAEGTCGGQALAALIDIERLRAALPEPYRVSARMIFQCALLKSDPGADGVTLRAVIKAFYNYGVCRDALWPYEPGGEPGQITVERARDAKAVSLGAYYRLRPNLNTYHAALHEAGALLVSAELHDGWLPEAVRANAGTIVPPPPNKPSDALAGEKHAFLVVGYTPQGFLVLNSWGREWGGWTPPDGAPVPGVALWRYDDWADTIMDGWVLRLGVGAAEAFEYSIGDQGLGFGADAPVRTTPVHAILGNFLHLDDGDFVHSGTYVSTRQTLDETLRLLVDDARSAKPYRGVLLNFAGGLQGVREAAEHVARWKRLVREARWYPFSILWCADYAEQARAVLESVFREAIAQAGGPGPRLDRLVEERAHGLGRAFWRDIVAAADRMALPDGPLHALARAGAALRAARPGFGLRIVAESEGAVAVAALLSAMRSPPFSAEAAPFFAMLESVDLVAPPLAAAEYAALARDLDAGWGGARPGRRLRVHLPSARDEQRLAVAPYGRSYFELVERAFLRRGADEPPAPAPGAPAPRFAPRWNRWLDAPRTEFVEIAWPKAAPRRSQGAISQIELLYRSDVGGRLAAILRRRSPARQENAAATRGSA